MKMFLRRFAAALLAGAALTAAPVLAKEAAAEAPKPPKLSKPVAAALSEAQKLQQAGDSAGSLAKIKEAEAFPTPTADDSYFILQLKLNAGIGLKDNAMIEDSLTKLLATGRVAVADQPKFYSTVGQLAMARKDYNAATMAYEQVARLRPNDGESQIALAELYYAQKQSAKAVTTLNNAIAGQKASGQPVPESWYRRTLAVAYDGKLASQVQPAALALVKAYPNPVNWRDAIIITRDSFQMDDQGALDFMRLQAATGSLNGERDFIEYADTALGKGFPGEAKFAVEEGLRRNMLSTSKPMVAELQKSANAKVAADKASLPALKRRSRAIPSWRWQPATPIMAMPIMPRPPGSIARRSAPRPSTRRPPICGWALPWRDRATRPAQQRHSRPSRAAPAKPWRNIGWRIWGFRRGCG